MIDKPAILGGKPVSDKKIRFTEILIGEEEKRAVEEIVRSKQFVSGEYLTKFEKEFSSFVGTKHAIAVSNGTDALFLSYLALGLTFNKKVLTTPLTFVASASTIIHAGAIPYFVDVGEDSNISPSAVERGLASNKFDAITVVHMYGKPVKMDEIKSIAKEEGLLVIEDAAHAHGAEYKGQKIGSWGDIAAFSLYPTKILAAGGWGGVITTNDDEVAEKLKLLRAHGELRALFGSKGAYLYKLLGYNMRMSHIEAVIAYYQLRKINDFITRRRKIAKMLNERLSGIDGIKVPIEEKNEKHVYYIYSININESKIGWDRDTFVEALDHEGIEARRGYHVPLHKQELFLNINDPNVNHFALVNKYPDYSRFELPNAEKLSRTTIWLPMHPNISEEDVEKIVKAIEKLILWKKARAQ